MGRDTGIAEILFRRVHKMVESRCGLICKGCEWKEKEGCTGCVNMNNPFWGTCNVKNGCVGKGLEHCGQCADFPCDELTSMQEGDNRVEQCKIWAKAEKNGEGCRCKKGCTK